MLEDLCWEIENMLVDAVAGEDVSPRDVLHKFRELIEILEDKTMDDREFLELIHGRGDQRMTPEEAFEKTLEKWQAIATGRLPERRATDPCGFCYFADEVADPWEPKCDFCMGPAVASGGDKYSPCGGIISEYFLVDGEDYEEMCAARQEAANNVVQFLLDHKDEFIGAGHALLKRA